MDDDTKKKLWIGLPAIGAVAAAAMIGKTVHDRRRKPRNVAEKVPEFRNTADEDSRETD